MDTHSVSNPERAFQLLAFIFRLLLPPQNTHTHMDPAINIHKMAVSLVTRL